MPSHRALRLVDAALAAWVAAWIGLGVAIGVNVDNLTGLSHTVAQEGRAVQSVGHALGALGSVPIVGGEASKTAAGIQAAGAGAVRSGESSASSVATLSVLLAIAVALLPSVPVFGFYLPLRLQRAREARALRRTVNRQASSPHLQELLALRALQSLGYERLQQLGPLSWADGPEPRDALAAAELQRLGLDPAELGQPARGPS